MYIKVAISLLLLSTFTKTLNYAYISRTLFITVTLCVEDPQLRNKLLGYSPLIAALSRSPLLAVTSSDASPSGCAKITVHQHVDIYLNLQVSQLLQSSPIIRFINY